MIWYLLQPVVLFVPLIGAVLAVAFLVRRIGDRMRWLEDRQANLQAHLKAIEVQLNQLGSAPGGPTAEPLAIPTVPTEAATTARTPSRVAQASDGPPPLPAVSAVVPAAMPVPSPGPADRPATTGPTTGLEERLGTRWAVWIGGIALALGGMLLVRHAIEQGWIGPEVRIALGALLAATLIGLGEWLRRDARALGQQGPAVADIPSVLTAAGTVTAFGTAYAAHALYGFVGPEFAFVLLAAIGLAAMLAATVHGPALAGLGLVGALATPLLVTSDTANAWPVVLLTGVLAAASHQLGQWRRWPWLSICAVIGAALWGLLLMATVDQFGVMPATASALPIMTHSAVQLALAAGLLGWLPHRGRPDQGTLPDLIVSLCLLILTALAMLSILMFRLDPNWLWFCVAIVVILAATAWTTAAASPAAALAGAAAVAAVLAWAFPGIVLDDVTQPIGLGLPALNDSIRSYLTFTGALTLLASAAAGLRLLRGRELPLPTAAFYAGAAAVPPLLALILAYLRLAPFEISHLFAGLALTLSLVCTVAAERFLRREQAPANEPSAALRLGTGAMASAAIAALALALTFALDRGALTVALALAGLGAAYVAVRIDVPALRLAVGALGLIVLARLIWEPRVVGADLGVLPVFNWLLYGYGVPALAFGAAAVLLRRQRDDTVVALCQALALVFSALLVFWQIRHYLGSGDPLRVTSDHVEMGLLAMSAMGFAYVIHSLGLRRLGLVMETATHAFAAASLAIIVAGLGLTFNPLLSDELVNGGTLVLGYLLPAIGATALTRLVRPDRPRWYSAIAGTAAVALLFGFVTLEVRHAFLGQRIGLLRATSEAELWTYSAVWLITVIGLLAYGLLRRAPEARIASAVLITLTVIKVFVIDLAGIGGLWRALSFIGLGIVLVAIGWVYQTFVFGRRPIPDATLSGDR